MIKINDSEFAGKQAEAAPPAPSPEVSRSAWCRAPCDKTGWNFIQPTVICMTMPQPDQAAALPFRVKPDATVEVLLITARRSGRWVLPRGNIPPHLTPPLAAEKEAWEEAGIRGSVYQQPIGSFTRTKGDDPEAITLTVSVFPLSVEYEASEWPEAAVRQRIWVTPRVAASTVKNAEVSAIFERLSKLLGAGPPLRRS